MNPGMTGEVVLPRDPSNPVTSRNPSAIQRTSNISHEARKSTSARSHRSAPFRYGD